MPPMLMAVILLAARLQSYLLFHTLAEVFAVTVGLLTFFVAWNSYRFSQNDFLLYLGIGYLWVALLDLSHALTYPGMPFVQHGAVNTTLHAWIYGRLLEGCVLVTAPLFLHRKLRPNLALGLFSLLGLVLLGLGLGLHAPRLYSQAAGLLPLKIAAEYFVVALLTISIVFYWKLRARISPQVASFMIVSMVLTILAEICFTLYVDVYGALNLTGHLFKLLSFWMIYQAISREMLQEPFSLVAREAHTYDAIPYPAVLVDHHGYILQVNRATEDSLQARATELVGNDVHARMHPADVTPENCPLCQAIRASRPIEGRVVYFPGHARWQLVSLNPLSRRHRDGGMVQVSIDITDRARAEEAVRDSRNLLSTVMNSCPDWIFIKDADFRYIYANASYAKALNLSPEDMLGKSDDELGFDREMIYGNPAKGIRGFRVDDKLVLDGQPLRNPFDPARAADGSLRVFDTVKQPLRNSRGEIYGILGYARDVGDRLDMEQELQQAASLFDCTSEGIMVTDAGGRITKVNQAFCDITGYSKVQALGRSGADIHDGWSRADVAATMQDELARKGRWQGESWNTRCDGSHYPQWATVSVVHDSQGEVKAQVCAFSDITPLKQTEQALEYQAQHDALTGLPNRLLLEARLEQAIKHCLRQRTTAAMLFMDLDNFKHINDSLGHPVGDQVLRRVGDILHVCLREADMVARQGGDEFMVLLEDVHTADQVSGIAQKLLDALKAPIQVDSYELYLGASIGIALCPSDGTATDALIRNADAAMYLAKQAGRQTFRFYTQALNDQAARRLAIESGIRQAVQRGDIEVVFQPQADLAGGRLIGAEALARWRHQELGDVSPMEFIPVAESIGVIGAIGAYVLDHAVAQTARLQREIGITLRIAVNLSSRQLDDPDMVDQVAACLARHEFPPSQLYLEITEAVLLRNDQAVRHKLQRLKAMGVGLALDDFGTGYSSLGYLKHFPIDSLKIDRSFVGDVVLDPGDDAVLVRAIVAMGHGLGMSVLAEGVETPEQRDFLLEEGCDMIQGVLFSPPLTIDDFERLLNCQEQHGSTAVGMPETRGGEYL